MLDLVELLRNKYHGRHPRYLSNEEVGKFLDENRDSIEIGDIKELEEYYKRETEFGRAIIKKWVKENEAVIIHKEKIRKANRTFPLEKEFVDLLTLRRYARKTIKAYRIAVLVANDYFQKREGIVISEADKEQFHAYFQYLTVERKVSESTVRIARFAIEYYRNEIILKPIHLDFAYGIRKKEHLPTIFSKWEVVKILNSCTNLKHKLILSLLYSAGLRLSEVIHLKVKDIDLLRKTISIREGKGGKDRISVLSEKLISDLSVFLQNRNPTDILFPSNQKSDSGNEKPLSARTVEHVFASALKKSGIRKYGTPHDFRHSFATHLLETGTDIHFIQKLLGHRNLSTTTIYTKLANPKVAGVKSPL